MSIKTIGPRITGRRTERQRKSGQRVGGEGKDGGTSLKPEYEKTKQGRSICSMGPARGEATWTVSSQSLTQTFSQAAKESTCAGEATQLLH